MPKCKRLFLKDFILYDLLDWYKMVHVEFISCSLGAKNNLWQHKLCISNYLRHLMVFPVIYAKILNG